MTRTRQGFGKRTGIQRKQCVSNNIAFLYFKHYMFIENKSSFFTRTRIVCLHFMVPLLQNRKITTQISQSFLTTIPPGM